MVGERKRKRGGKKRGKEGTLLVSKDRACICNLTMPGN